MLDYYQVEFKKLEALCNVVGSITIISTGTTHATVHITPYMRPHLDNLFKARIIDPDHWANQPKTTVPSVSPYMTEEERQRRIDSNPDNEYDGL